MAKIKLTKGELKRQRDALSQFLHYLPTLQLKKQQLQIKILDARKRKQEKENQIAEKEAFIKQWVGLLADPGVAIEKWLEVENILTDTNNIAGSNVCVFKEVIFKDVEIDYFSTPLWVDRGVMELRSLIRMLIEIDIINQEIDTLKKELMVTTQRVNLFEKVKIPECLENIRKIRIYLGDLQANAVGIGKVAKKKIEIREMVGFIS